MLIQPDRHELGDKRLDPAENVAKQREELLAMAAKHKLGKQDELEDPERAKGPRLHCNDIIRRLLKVIPTLRVKDGSPGNVALYIHRNPAEVEDAINSWEFGKNTFFLYHKYVGGLPNAQIPEFSTIDIDSSHLPTREHRGWRSVLITLLKQGIVSYNALIKEFGDVGTDRRGWRWNEQTQKWRNNPDSQFSSSNISQ
jgi:hypothetical protein